MSGWKVLGQLGQLLKYQTTAVPVSTAFPWGPQEFLILQHSKKAQGDPGPCSTLLVHCITLPVPATDTTLLPET